MSPDLQTEYDEILAEFRKDAHSMALEILRLRYGLRQVRRHTTLASKAGQWSRVMVRPVPPQDEREPAS